MLEKVYKIKPSFISKMIKDLLKMPQVDFFNGFYPEIIFEIWPDKIKDFGDAVLTAVALKLNYPIFTFDKKFYRQLKKENVQVILLD